MKLLYFHQKVRGISQKVNLLACVAKPPKQGKNKSGTDAEILTGH
jgi:hypothetical protein